VASHHRLILVPLVLFLDVQHFETKALEYQLQLRVDLVDQCLPLRRANSGFKQKQRNGVSERNVPTTRLGIASTASTTLRC
jgi:hypothetical protein